MRSSIIIIIINIGCFDITHFFKTDLVDRLLADLGKFKRIIHVKIVHCLVLVIVTTK